MTRLLDPRFRWQMSTIGGTVRDSVICLPRTGRAPLVTFSLSVPFLELSPT
jgi:hypothetical protein